MLVLGVWKGVGVGRMSVHGVPLTKNKEMFINNHSEVVFAGWLVCSTPSQEIVI